MPSKINMIKMSAPPTAIPAIAPVESRWEAGGVLLRCDLIATMSDVAPVSQVHLDTEKLLFS